MSSSTMIWIIDDSPTVRKLVETILKRREYTTRSFVDGVEAMKAVVHEQDLVIPSVIFLDIGMPKMDGYEVARELKRSDKYSSRFASTTVVMLTRRDGIIDRLKSRLAGSSEYMTKPFQQKAILDMVQHCLSHHKENDSTRR